MKNLKVDFPTLRRQTYLNTPVVGLIPKAVLDYKKEQHRLLWEGGSTYWEETGGLPARVREKIGEVYHARPGYIALFPAFSYGINAILEGLDQNRRVLLLENDYPSINLSAEARDFSISYVKIDENLEERIESAFQSRPPDVLVCSMVQYINGIKIDFSFLKELKTRFPETLFLGDGTQYLGTERFDFTDSAFDAVGASAYKWIGAGFGNGFFMFKPGVEHRILPKCLGPSSSLGKYKTGGDSFIGKFEGGHLNRADIGAIKVALEFQENVGLENIEKRVKELSRKAKTALSDLNLLENAVQQRKEHSNIFNIRGGEKLFNRLTAHKIACARRGKGIRIGLHYYNTDKDIENLLELVT